MLILEDGRGVLDPVQPEEDHALLTTEQDEEL
jgi:hypothetical protein